MERVDGAMSVYDLGDSRVGNVQFDGIDLLTYGSNPPRAECASTCPFNSGNTGTTSVSAFTGQICASPFGSEAYFTTGMCTTRWWR